MDDIINEHGGANTLETMRDIVSDYNTPTIQVVPADNDGTLKYLTHGGGIVVRPITRAEIEAQSPAPFARMGTATLQTVESLVEHTKRFADADSVIFGNADRQHPSLTTVFDYHKATAEGAPRWGRHRARFDFPLSDQWKTWTQQDRQKMTMIQFARFLEDNVTDVLAGTQGLDDHQQAFIDATGGSVASPGLLLNIAKTLQINENSEVKESRNLSSGEAEVAFRNAIEASVAGDVVKLPSAFIIGLPVFQNATDAYRVLARLRIDKSSGLKFWYELWRVKPTFDTAFTEACEKVREATALPLFYGTPEA